MSFGGKLDANRYATKKTIAQGMLDIALLTSNASQLRYIIQVGDSHEFYTAMMVLLISSIVLQGLNGILQLVMGPMNINKEEHKTFLNIVNQLSLGFAFAVAAIDVIKVNFAPPVVSAI